MNHSGYLARLDNAVLPRSLGLPSMGSIFTLNATTSTFTFTTRQFFYNCLHGQNGQHASAALRLPRTNLSNYNNFVTVRKYDVSSEITPEAVAEKPLLFNSRIRWISFNMVTRIFKKLLRKLLRTISLSEHFFPFISLRLLQPEYLFKLIIKIKLIHCHFLISTFRFLF